MTRVTLIERARVSAAGYIVVRDSDGWRLRHPSSDADVSPTTKGWMHIGADHGTLSPTEWEAYAEALARIEQDERIAGELEAERIAWANLPPCHI